MAATPPAQDATVSHGTGNPSPKVRVEGAVRDVGAVIDCLYSHRQQTVRQIGS